MEQVEGKEIIRATIGKTNEIKITCDQVRVANAKMAFSWHPARWPFPAKASNAFCERLTIHLHEDYLHARRQGPD